ncbi:hypothetical protein IJT17_07770, partial [bacterium]|nr:hypothetical protein [bacterium]
MDEHKVFHELTIYDVFLGIVGHKSISLDRLKTVMWLRDDSNVEQCLSKLLEQKLIVKKNDEYSSSESTASKNLFDLLSFALSVDLDYNYYLTDDMKTLISSVYGRHSFSADDCGSLSKNKVHKMVRRLCLDNLAILFTYAPMSAKLISNHFYDLLCSYWKISPKRPGFFERRVKIELIIMEHVLAHTSSDRNKLVSGSKLYFSPGDNVKGLLEPPSKLQNLLKFDVIPNNPDIFDTQQRQNTNKAIEFQNQMLDSMRQ